MAVETSFEDAISALTTRYNDLGLRRLDRNGSLRLKTRSLPRKLSRKFDAARRRGCTVESIDHDFSLNINRRCNVKATLIADSENSKLFFSHHRKCAPFVRMIDNLYTRWYEDYFGTDQVTCKVNLASAFGRHSSAIGRVQGDVIIFDGIKYGEHQRFMKSTPASNPRSNDFSSPSFSCPTASYVLTGSTTLPRTTPEEEDCLYLKITAPLSAFEDGAPQRKVITWIHGGTFNYGGMDVMFEDPTPLVAEQDIIVVKMNYRLGAFGGWYFPVRTDGQPKSNFAFSDQRLAMKWVHDNIGSFNGDAEDITLAGASAGGASVAFHLTHEDSYDYFNNAMLMSTTTTPYWSEDHAAQAYARLAIKLECATKQNFQAVLQSGRLLQCLQNYPIDQFKAVMAEHGRVFGDIALRYGRLSQMEFSFAPNFDGETLVNDPLTAIRNGQFKSDLGFLNIEVATDEATAISENLFGDPAMRTRVYGEAANYLWQPHINPDVTAPWTVYLNMITEHRILSQAVGSIVSAFPCELNEAEFGYDAWLKTECIEPVADFLTAYLFTCPVDYATEGTQVYNQNLYQVMFGASTPGPGPDSGSNIMQPYGAPFYKCFAATENKACHVEGARYFFGEYINQNLAVTDAERDFGLFYRTTYADLIKNGRSDVLTAGYSTWNKLTTDQGFVGEQVTPPCEVFNQIAPNGAAYGKL